MIGGVPSCAKLRGIAFGARVSLLWRQYATNVKCQRRRQYSLNGAMCSPEIIQSLPYGEKADIWSLGCLLYQMSTLQPPFHSSNMLTLANKVRYYTVSQKTHTFLSLYMFHVIAIF